MAYAQTEAPGMTKEGPMMAGNFQQGQTLEQAVQLTPNKCYTVLAVGAGVQEVDLVLVAAPPFPPNMPPQQLARDSGTGAYASLGGKGNCYKWPYQIPVQGKYIVTAAQGQGIIASQLYTK
jgi:hypothetical protein